MVCGAMTGVTFAFLNMVKDTKVEGNLMMSRASSKVLATGELFTYWYDTGGAWVRGCVGTCQHDPDTNTRRHLPSTGCLHNKKMGLAFMKHRIKGHRRAD